jgi:exoribonuclease R
MLLTNISVAEQIAVHIPEQALLRRHDTPIERRLVSLIHNIHLASISLIKIHRLHSLSAPSVWVTKSIPQPLEA